MIPGVAEQISSSSLPLTAGVCAVVVTFNRKNLLRECLETVLNQSRLPDHILVVDNHSTDGTVEMLRAEFESMETGPGITILPLGENRGGAGGFAAGFDWAHRNGFDWVWVMDDDIEMLPGTLEMLLSYQDVSDFVQCRRKSVDSELILDSLWDVSSGTPSHAQARMMHEQGTRPWLSVQWGNFEGALIHRSVIDKVGLPDERFFIGGDDSTYGLEASFHTNVIFVKEYGVQRKLAIPARRSRLNFYLFLRNRFLMREHLLKLGFSVHPVVFWTSQMVSLAWAVKTILKDSGEHNKFMMLRAVVRGLVDGANGRFGRPPFLNA